MNSLSSELPISRPHDDRISVAVVAAALVLGAIVAVDPKLGVTMVFALAAAVFVATTVERPVLGLLAMVPAATLDVVGRVATISGVPFTIYQLLTLLTVIAVAMAWRRGRLFPAPSPMDVPVLVFLALVVTAVPLAASPKLAFISSASLISSAVMLFLTVWLVTDVSTAGRIMIVIAVVAGALGALAVAERLHIFALQGTYFELWRDGIRARVTFRDPNILGAFLGPASLLAIAWGIGDRRPLVRILMLLASLAAVAGLFATLSRGAWGGWLAGLIVVLLLIRMPFGWRVLLGAGLFAGLSAVLLFVLDPVWVEAKILGVTGNASALYRVWMARGALAAFADHLMGVGPGQYPLVFPLYRDAFVKTNLVESHTAYLTILVEIGLLGFMAFVWLLWRYFVKTLQAVRALDDRVQAMAVGSLAAGVALCAQAFTYSLESSKILWFTFGLGMAAYRLATRPAGLKGTEGESVE